ncbi:TPA: type IV secretion system protein [Yersinia enterocolitica]|jgi:type IV secretion system protein VirB6|nr:type IV secretion system protein [Yersinia enterocolitica]
MATDNAYPVYDGNFFQATHDVIFTAFEKSTSGMFDNYINIAYTLGKYGISIYVLWYAFTVLVKKQQNPVQDFIWNLFRFWLILIFVRNIGGWLDSANQAIDGLKDTFAGGDPWLWMDQLWGKIIAVGKKVWHLDTDTIPIVGVTAALLTYAGGILAMIVSAIVFFSAEITLRVLSITAPLFILCLSFGFLRQMFNNWLQAIFSSLLVFLFAALALRAGMWQLNGTLSITLSSATAPNLFEAGATVLVSGLFMGWIIWQAKTYASQLAGVGVEGALQGAAAMGIGAGVFGASRFGSSALGMGRNAGIGAWKGIRRQEGGLGQSTGLSGKLGNLTGQGVNIGAKKLRSAAIEMAKKKYGG